MKGIKNQSSGPPKIIRIVRLHIKKEQIESFQKIFKDHQRMVQNFTGCHQLELWQSALDQQQFMTYSIWENEHALEQYRSSSLFNRLWLRVKPLFESKAKAWSLQEI